MKVCKKCGCQVNDDVRFCPQCGEPVTEPAYQQQYQQQSYQQYQQDYQQQYQQQTGKKIAMAENVDFIGAIKKIFNNYSVFDGRATRSEYWWVFLFNILIGFVPGIGQVAWIAMLVPSIAVGVRRLHDVGKKGTYYFMGLIPLVGWIFLLVAFAGDSMPDNEYGPAAQTPDFVYQQGQPYQSGQPYEQETWFNNQFDNGNNNPNN